MHAESRGFDSKRHSKTIKVSSERRCLSVLQAVDHPYLVVHSATAPGAGEATRKLQEEEAQGLLQGICGICKDHLEDPVVSSCRHTFCRACMTDYLDAAQSTAKCPTCDKPLTVDLSSTSTVSACVFEFAKILNSHA